MKANSFCRTRLPRMRKGMAYVEDRENARIQVFDSEGKFLAQWREVGHPYGIFAHPISTFGWRMRKLLVSWRLLAMEKCWTASGLRVEDPKTRLFLRISGAIEQSFSAVKTAWRRGRDSITAEIAKLQ